MTTVDLKVSIGMGPNEMPDQIKDSFKLSSISAKAQINKQNIKNHYNYFSNVLNKFRLPTFIIDMPSKFQRYQIPIIKASQGQFNCETAKIQDRLYHMVQFKTSELLAMIKKLQKAFEKLTELNNNVFINCHLYEKEQFLDKLQEKQLDFLSVFLQHAELQAKVDLDKKFMNIIGSSLGQISPGFQNSPVMAFLQMLHDLQLQIELDSPLTLQNSTRDNILSSIFGFEMPDDDQSGQLLLQMMHSKEMVHIYVDFKKLGYLQISFETRFYAFIQCAVIH